MSLYSFKISKNDRHIPGFTKHPMLQDERRGKGWRVTAWKGDPKGPLLRQQFFLMGIYRYKWAARLAVAYYWLRYSKVR